MLIQGEMLDVATCETWLLFFNRCIHLVRRTFRIARIIINIIDGEIAWRLIGSTPD